MYQKIYNLVEENPELEEQYRELLEKYDEDKQRLAEKRLKNKDKNEDHIETAHIIMKYTKFITMKDNDEIYWYNGSKGIWETDGKIKIRQTCQNLNDRYTTHEKNEIIDKIRCDSYRDREILNSKPLLGMLNGVWDYKKNYFLEHSPENYLTRRINAEYNPEAIPVKWEQFLQEILNQEDIPIIQEMIGYCLCIGYPIHKVFIMTGGGANGKSTLLNGIGIFLGRENTSNIPMQDFDTNQYAAAKLFGKYANIVADITDEEMKKTGKLKQLTGGDRIWSDVKYHTKGIEFVNGATLIYSANKLPAIKYDDSMAIFRRMTIIDFPNEFKGEKVDSELLEKLTTKEELSGLLNSSLMSLTKLMDRGYFEGDPDWDELERNYIMKSDSTHAFLKYGVVDSPKGKITNKLLFRCYSKFCHVNNITPVHMQSLTKAIPRWKYNAIPFGGNERGWYGIKVKRQYAAEEEEVIQ